MKKYGIAIILAVIGMFMVIGAIGTDDFFIKVLKQEHTLQIGRIIIGLILCAPLPIMGYLDGR